MPAVVRRRIPELHTLSWTWFRTATQRKRLSQHRRGGHCVMSHSLCALRGPRADATGALLVGHRGCFHPGSVHAQHRRHSRARLCPWRKFPEASLRDQECARLRLRGHTANVYLTVSTLMSTTRLPGNDTLSEVRRRDENSDFDLDLQLLDCEFIVISTAVPLQGWHIIGAQ